MHLQVSNFFVFFISICLPDYSIYWNYSSHSRGPYSYDGSTWIVVMSLLFHVSAAFDTVNHSTLLFHLQNWFSLGLDLCIGSRRISHLATASPNDSTSAFSTRLCDVLQDSVLGPLLFTLYTTHLGSVISLTRNWNSKTIYATLSPKQINVNLHFVVSCHATHQIYPEH